MEHKTAAQKALYLLLAAAIAAAAIAASAISAAAIASTAGFVEINRT